MSHRGDSAWQAPGGRRVEGTVDTWERVTVECGEREAMHRLAYDMAGWTSYWPYDFMPAWLRPAWHHEEALNA